MIAWQTIMDPGKAIVAINPLANIQTCVHTYVVVCMRANMFTDNDQRAGQVCSADVSCHVRMVKKQVIDFGTIHEMSTNR